MQVSERQRLEYHPSLRYKPDLYFLAQNAGLPTEAANQYQLPSALTQILQYPGATAINTIEQVRSKAEQLASDLALCIGPTPESTGALTGKVQTEALAITQQIGQQANQLLVQGHNALFPANLTVANEEQTLLNLVQQDMQGQGDATPWLIRSDLAKILQEQADGLRQVLTDLEAVCYQTVANQFGDQVEPVIQTLMTAEQSVLSALQAMMAERFTTLNAATVHVQQRLDRLDTDEMLSRLLTRITGLTAQYIAVFQPLTKWVVGVDTEWDAHPIMPLLNTSLDQLGQLQQQLQQSLLELKKLTTMRLMDYDSYLTLLSEKKQVRQFHRLLTEMIDRDPDQTAAQFVAAHELAKPGTLCTI